jgi:hypothetical protein
MGRKVWARGRLATASEVLQATTLTPPPSCRGGGAAALASAGAVLIHAADTTPAAAVRHVWVWWAAEVARVKRTQQGAA